MLTVRLYARQLHSILLKTTPSLTNIWKGMTMVGNISPRQYLGLRTVWLDSSSLGLEPRRQRNDAVDIFVDLGATLEDHDEVTNRERSNSTSTNLR